MFPIIVAVVFAEETAIAKGIRRIAGITGTEAVQAQQDAAILGKRAQEVAARFKQHGLLGSVDSDLASLRYEAAVCLFFLWIWVECVEIVQLMVV